MRLFDTHAHLNAEEFDANLPEVLRRAQAAGVETMIVVGTTAESSHKAVQLATEHSQLRAAVGIQPNYVAQAADGDWEKIVRLANNPHVVAIGETGLDRYWNDAPFPLQQDFFDRHIRLASQVGLPFIVHMRECEEDVLAMLRDAQRRGPLRGVMHSFTGTQAGATEFLQLGLHISFAGMVTYKKSEELRNIAATVPADRILIETDSPYLSPHPQRNVQPNEPALLVHTAKCLAEARGERYESFAEQTANNAASLFRRV